MYFMWIWVFIHNLDSSVFECIYSPYHVRFRLKIPININAAIPMWEEWMNPILVFLTAFNSSQDQLNFSAFQPTHPACPCRISNGYSIWMQQCTTYRTPHQQIQQGTLCTIFMMSCREIRVVMQTWEMHQQKPRQVEGFLIRVLVLLSLCKCESQTSSMT